MLELVVASLDVEAGPLAALLSADESQRAARFCFERDRRRYTVARARLRQLLARRLDAAPEALQFAYDSKGKPRLGTRYARDLRFNVSHCGELAAYAFTEGREVGVDVEEVRVLPDADEVAMRVFSQRERAAYLRLPARERPRGFFSCWTRKEAFIKAIGDGLSHPLQALDVSLPPAGWTLASFVPAAGLVGAVAVRQR